MQDYHRGEIPLGFSQFLTDLLVALCPPLLLSMFPFQIMQYDYITTSTDVRSPFEEEGDEEATMSGEWCPMQMQSLEVLWFQYVNTVDGLWLWLTCEVKLNKLKRKRLTGLRSSISCQQLHSDSAGQQSHIHFLVTMPV